MGEPETNLEPLPYHVELRDYLKSEERDLWNWFASAQAQADYAQSLRLELLKTSYRLGPDEHPELYQSVEESKSRLQLNIPVTLYQAQNNPRLNAALYYLPGQGHLVFSGPVFTLLSPAEFKSVLGHELAHYHLWDRDSGEFHITDRLLQAVANDPRASPSHEQTARRHQLYTEIFADRGSLRVTGDLQPVIAGLVKIETGLSHVSAASYLEQAQEIFANGNVATQGVSHPETFIRARALALWQEQSPQAITQISRMIEGAAKLDDLDLLGQQRLTSTTRRLIERLLRPKWFQTAATLGHAKQFFHDFRPLPGPVAPARSELISGEPALGEYLCYVLLDFVRADPELEELPLAAALELSRELELDTQFERLAMKEFKLRPRDLRRLKEEAAAMLAQAEVQGE